MEETIFTKIIKGEIPSHKVYEDDKTLAIVDIYPIQPGMVLVLAKPQVDHLWDLSEEDYAALMATVRKVGQRLREAFPEKKRVGIIVEGFEVPHAHVKVFPIDNGNEVRAMPSTKEPDHAVFADLAKRLAFQ
ncbi:MAG TPA: HIT family protein [Patescibacteria group bacterium]|nr:HIT family protein [Patescibacteria group bacterium]